MARQPNQLFWQGPLRFNSAVLFALLIISTITLGLSIAYGRQIAHAPLDAYGVRYSAYHRWSRAYFVFYSGTMPLLTMLHVATDLTLTVLGLLHPIYALAGSVTLVCGWAVQVGFWTECDLPANLENSAGSCYQSQLQKDSRTGDPTGVSTALANAKVAFAFLTFFLYITYMGFAAAAVHKRRTFGQGQGETEFAVRKHEEGNSIQELVPEA